MHRFFSIWCLILLVMCVQATHATEILAPAFEDATLTGDLNARILSGGPMIAYTTPREVGIWVSTAKEARVRLAYYDETAVEKVRVTAEVQTSRRDAFTVLFRCDRVEPGRKYFYKVYINGKTHRLPFERSFLTPGTRKSDTTEHRLALLGAHAVNDPVYPPENPVAGYPLLDTLVAANPTAMFWVGNSTLVREADKSSRAGYDLRYSYARNWTPMQSLQATLPQYAAPGADDLGASPNNGWLASPGLARQTFNRFWPVTERLSKASLAYTYSIGGVSVFVLDAFSHRQVQARYGPDQLAWLSRGLVASQDKMLRVISLGEPLTRESYRSETKDLLRALKMAAKNAPILLTSPGSAETFVVPYAAGLTQLVLGPFSQKLTPAASSRDKPQLISEQQVFGLLTWTGETLPELAVYTASGQRQAVRLF